MESVFIEVDGLPVPFFVTGYKSRNQDELVFSFDDIDNEQKAKSLLNCDVWLHADYIETSIADPEFSTENQSLIGYEVIDVNKGHIGILEEVLEIDQNPLLRVMQNKKEILIPLQPEFIEEVDDSAKKIFVNTPEGLVDLY